MSSKRRKNQTKKGGKVNLKEDKKGERRKKGGREEKERKEGVKGKEFKKKCQL